MKQVGMQAKCIFYNEIWILERNDFKENTTIHETFRRATSSIRVQPDFWVGLGWQEIGNKKPRG
ncbi:MAG TPA: hypothetical protein VGH37_11745, partial [Candidatus Acidoferrum sp.]